MSADADAEPTPETLAIWQAKEAETVDQYVARGRRLAALRRTSARVVCGSTQSLGG